MSLQALSEKVNPTEPRVVRELVQGCAARLMPVLEQLKLQQPSWAAGYRVRVLDGNHLAASQKRLKPLRGFRGAAPPGQSLGVYAPEWDLVVDLVPAEDAHAQERALMGPVLERVRAGELWLADRHFSTTRILFGMDDKQAAFLIREHGRSPHPAEVGPLKKVGRVETGVVFEQAVEVEDEQGRRLRLRRIELQWDEPTEDGDTCIRLLTNVPAERMGAKTESRACVIQGEDGLSLRCGEASVTLLRNEKVSLKGTSVETTAESTLRLKSMSLQVHTPGAQAASAGEEATRLREAGGLLPGEDVAGVQVIQGQESLTLRCGQASLTLLRNGRVLLEGTYVETRAEGVIRLRGDSVQVN